MKKLFFGLLVLLAAEACTKYEEFPLRPVSFEIDGRKFYSAKDTQTMPGNIFGGGVQMPDTLRIVEHEDGSFDLLYQRKTDFLNYDIYSISLDLKGIKGIFESGARYEFNAADSLEAYPYVSLTPVQSSSAYDEDVYVAEDGWIEIYEINHRERFVSGVFEFEAVLDDEDECLHPDKVCVKNGSFRNIPFKVVSVNDFQP